MSNKQIAEKLLSENQNCNCLVTLITCPCGTFEVHCLLLKIVQKLFKNQINLIFVQLFKSCIDVNKRKFLMNNLNFRYKILSCKSKIFTYNLLTTKVVQKLYRV